MLKGKMSKQPFTTMIYSGSPIKIFTKEDVRNILKSDLGFTRPLSKKEQYVYYNGKTLNLLGIITVDVQVGKRNIKKARLVIARDGKRSLIGRDWLTQLNSHVAEAKPESGFNNIINHVDKVGLSPELKQKKNKFPKLLKRHGKFQVIT